MAVKNINDLRKHAAETLELLDNGDIDVTQAACNAKLYESMISSLKAELDYHRMLKQTAIIDFLDCAKVIEPNMKVIEQKKLVDKKSK